MTIVDQPKLVTVFGGSGFVGRYIVRELAKRGYRIRVAVRRPHLAFHLQPLGQVGQIVAVQANLRNRQSVERAVYGADHVVNCVGILFESRRNTFDAVQNFGARAVAEAARAAGVPLTHISAIGADPRAASAYARSKGRGERAVMEARPDAVIVRPSIMFGPEDGFFNKFADMTRFSPFIPLVGGGHTRLQPVYVADVAEVVARSVDGAVEAGRVYELGGPDVMTFRQSMQEMLRIIHRRRLFVSLPFGLASFIGSIASAIPFVEPPLTPDQVTLLKSDNVVSQAATEEGRDFAGLAMRPANIGAVLPSYLVRFRVAGQFTRGSRLT